MPLQSLSPLQNTRNPAGRTAVVRTMGETQRGETIVRAAQREFHDDVADAGLYLLVPQRGVHELLRVDEECGQRVTQLLRMEARQQQLVNFQSVHNKGNTILLEAGEGLGELAVVEVRN